MGEIILSRIHHTIQNTPSHTRLKNEGLAAGTPSTTAGETRAHANQLRHLRVFISSAKNSCVNHNNVRSKSESVYCKNRTLSRRCSECAFFNPNKRFKTFAKPPRHHFSSYHAHARFPSSRPDKAYARGDGDTALRNSAIEFGGVRRRRARFVCVVTTIIINAGRTRLGVAQRWCFFLRMR